MTGQEMVFNFQQLVQTVSPAFNVKEKLDTWEILEILNRTQERFIRLKYLNNNSFEQNAYRLSSSPDDVASLLKVSEENTMKDVAGINYAKEVLMPADFFAYVRSDSKISRSLPISFSEELVGNIEADYNKLDFIITTPYNKPILEAPVVSLKDDTAAVSHSVYGVALLVILDSYTTLHDIYITYIKKPEKIDIHGADCELADYMHEDMVKLAVSMYLDEYKLKLAGGKKDA